MSIFSAVLITDWCSSCQDDVDMELNTISLTIECQVCKKEYTVSAHYANLMVEGE